MPTEFSAWREASPGDYAVVGDPVGHSKSPAMHHAAYEALGFDLTYRAVHVPKGELAEALDHLARIGYRGVNVTVPHKPEALAWAADPDFYTRGVGAANTLDLLTGRATNTDGPGFLRSLDGPPPRSALVLGAGGSAAAVVASLAHADADVRVWNRNSQRAIERCRRLNVGARVADRIDLSGFDLVVNATSASLGAESLAIDWVRAAPYLRAVDLAYGEGPTPFVAAARAVGLQAEDGRAMLAAQGALALEWWMPGVAAPLDVMQSSLGA